MIIVAVVGLIVASAVLSSFYPMRWYTPDDPTTVAAPLLKTAVTYPAQLKTRGQVTFGDGTFLNVRGIATAAQAGVTAEDLCLSMGDFEDNPRGFESIAGGETIRYSGSIPQTVILEAVCEFGKSGLVSILAAYNKENDLLNACSFGEDQEDDLLCIIMIRHPVGS